MMTLGTTVYLAWYDFRQQTEHICKGEVVDNELWAGTKQANASVPLELSHITTQYKPHYSNNMFKYIYLSGPISGLDTEERFKAFEEKEEMFKSEGFKVFNPMKNGLPPDSTTHQHMRRDLSVLTNEEIPISHIFMMKYWTHSAGCWKEFETAVSCGITVIFEEMNVHEGILLLSARKYACLKFE